MRRDCASALADPAAADSILASDGPPHGARNLLRIWPAAVNLARNEALLECLKHPRVLGPKGGIVRGLYLDKPAGTGWALPWHRDTTIAVRAHGIVGRFMKPTIKAGVPHVEAPTELLATMVTARIHLDAMTDENGPLRVVPGSHLLGTEIREEKGITLHCLAGDVLLIRPLLLHSSAHCIAGHEGHRRIVHLEFAPTADLLDGYEWHTYIRI